MQGRTGSAPASASCQLLALMRLKDPPLLCGAVLISGLVVIAGRLNGMPELSWIFPALTIGLIAWSSWLRGRLANHYAQFVTLGLSISLVADLLRLTGDQFLAGTALLMVACLSYTRAFAAELPLRLNAWPMLLTIALAALLAAGLWPLLPPVAQAPVLAMVLILALMIGQAVCRWRGAPPTSRAGARLALLGALLIGLSIALIIADTAFQALPLATLWILSTYWLGQAMIALSVPMHTADPVAVD